MRTTSHDGVRITFEVVGRGRPLVLLHGFYGDRTTWHQSGHVAALADDHRLVLIDAHGHGESDAPHDTDHLAARRTSRLTALIAGGAHAGAVAADPDEVAQEAELFRTQGTAPFIAWLERSGPLPPWFRTTMQAADPGDREPRLPSLRLRRVEFARTHVASCPGTSWNNSLSLHRAKCMPSSR
ncbi:alpha/beta fold hydrolase [Actinomadura chokoriensis]|uniref:alpha/beta fold hydrolase n=1 Tax=Actinomadura chokoriensis TaxID=454156 RepID=UPI0031F9B389